MTEETTITAVEVVNPTEFGIEPAKANELIGDLPQIKAEREILAQQYSQVILLDIEQPETSKKARELRLQIRDNRTKKIEPWHKATKEVFLRGGQFIDAVKKKEVAENIRMEETLENIEKHFENKEKERKAILNAERIAELEPFNAFVPIGLNFGEISEEEYAKVLNGAKLQFKHQQEEEEKAEKERLRLVQISRLHNERKEELLPLWQFVENKDSNFGEMTEELFASVKSVANSKKIDFDNEQEKIRQENERLEKEKAELEAKAEKARKIAEEKLAKERKEQEAKLKAEQEAKAKIEAELQAKKEAEELAEKNRLAEIEKQKKEAEKLAKAPIKKQLSVWVNSFEIPQTNISNITVTQITSKFDAFKDWALKEIETL